MRVGTLIAVPFDGGHAASAVTIVDPAAESRRTAAFAPEGR